MSRNNKATPVVKTKMRTSEDVYHRLLWSDPTTLPFDVSTIVIGYDDRFLGRREMELSSFAPGGDVPWHRVQYFRNGGKCAIMSTDDGKTATITPQHWPRGATLLWSREGRIDRIFTAKEQQSTSDSQRQEAPSLSKSSHSLVEPHYRFQTLPTYHFNVTAKAWQSSQSSHNAAPAWSTTSITPPLTFVSYNVLDDVYPDGAMNCTQRWKHLLALLATLDADVIALQEATPRFLTQLSACDWARSSYHLSDCLVNGSAHTVDPSGLLLLSKARPAQLHYREHDNKRQLLAVYELDNGRLLYVANVHLTSDHHRSNATKRREQLQSLVDACGWESGDGRGVDVVVLGDTNMQEGEALPDGYIDSCERVGYTYDPTTNALAARISRSGRSARYDRVLVRRSNQAAGQALAVTSAELIGCQPVNGLFLSDHYGLLCRLDYSTQLSPRADSTLVRRYPPVHTSAVAILLPKAVWPALQSIREKNDPAYHRWPPHINLLYGFVSDDQLADACTVLKAVCAHIAPFTMSLGSLHTFRHRTSSTVYAAVCDEADSVKRLQRTLQAAFPLCSEQSKHSIDGFTPHCTVAKAQTNVNDSVRQWSAIASTWADQPFVVSRIAVLARNGDEPFRVFDRIALEGSKEPNTDDLVSAQQSGLKEATPPRTDSSDTRAAAVPGIDGVALHTAWQVDAQLKSTDVLHRFLATRAILCSDEELLKRDKLARLVVALCQSIVLDACDAPADVTASCAYVVGSGGLGVQSRSSDIDVLVCGPRHVSIREFFSSLRDKAASSLPPTTTPCRVRLVMDALVPVAVIEYGTLQVDVSYAQYPAHRSPLHCRPWSLSVSDLQLMDPSSSRAVCSILDMRLIQEAIPLGIRSAFVTALQCVRHWADMRGLSESKLGYLGGHSWVLLLTHACQRASTGAGHTQQPVVRSVDLLCHFFRLFSGWPWPTAAAIALVPRQRSEDVMPVLSPSYPHRNTARAVSRSTLKRLRAEFIRASSQLASVSLIEELDEARLFQAMHELCQPPSFTAEFESCIELSLAAVDDESLSVSCSFVESRLGELVADMDKLGVLAAPYRPRLQSGGLSRQLWLGLSSEGQWSGRHDSLSQEVQRFVRRCEAGLLRSSPSAVRAFKVTHRLVTSTVIHERLKPAQ